jgi:hypothetical protein
MNAITKLTIATAGAAFFTIGSSIVPAKAALLDFSFTATDVFQDGSINTNTGSFRLNTETREISNLGGVLNPPGSRLLNFSSGVGLGTSSAVLTVRTENCNGGFIDPATGRIICTYSSSFGSVLNLLFTGEDLFNELSSDPFVYESSLVSGMRPGPIGPAGQNAFNVTGSALIRILFLTEFPSPVTSLQVERVETVPEPTTTAAILAFGVLGASSGLLRKQQKKIV